MFGYKPEVDCFYLLFSHQKFPSDEVTRVSSHDHQRNHNHRHSYQVATSEHSVASQDEDARSGDTAVIPAKSDKAISSSTRNWIPSSHGHRNMSEPNFKSNSPVPHSRIDGAVANHEHNDKLPRTAEVGQKFYGVNQNGQVYNHTRSYSGSSTEFQQHPISHNKIERLPPDG